MKWKQTKNGCLYWNTETTDWALPLALSWDLYNWNLISWDIHFLCFRVFWLGDFE